MTTLQDRGRAASLSQGVPSAGAFDRDAFDLANRLVGNAPGTVAIEITMGGLRVVAQSSCVIALTGAIGASSVDALCPVALRAGDEIAIGRPTSGVRTYLAVRGGIDVPAVLGSRSWDSLGRIGPAPLEEGTELRVSDETIGIPPWGDPLPQRQPTGIVSISDGPHLDRLSSRARERWIRTTWHVTSQADRVGVHIEPTVQLELDGSEMGSLPSFPMLPGGVQLPPDGRPIILGPDAGVTGGYPVVGVVELSSVAQLRPGDEFRFVRRRTGSRSAHDQFDAR